MKIHPEGAEFVSCRQVDRQTILVAFCSFAYLPKKGYSAFNFSLCFLLVIRKDVGELVFLRSLIKNNYNRQLCLSEELSVLLEKFYFHLNRDLLATFRGHLLSIIKPV
jgi:hypothetical protein